MLRETGIALERAGARLQGSLVFEEQLNRHRRLCEFGSAVPALPADKSLAYIAPSATVLGNVKLGERTSVWYGAVIRGDVNHISIGAGSNIQDRAVVHVAKIGSDNPTVIGDGVSVEPAAVVHACTVEDGAYIGAAAIVLDGAVVGKGSLIAAGSVVTPGTKVPAGQLWQGSPAKFVRNLTADEAAAMRRVAETTYQLSTKHQLENEKTVDLTRLEQEARELEQERHKEYVSKIGYAQ